MHFCFKGFGWNNIEPGISKLLFVFFTVDSLPDRNCPDRNCRRCQPPIEIMLSIAHFKKDDRSWCCISGLTILTYHFRRGKRDRVQQIQQIHWKFCRLSAVPATIGGAQPPRWRCSRLPSTVGTACLNHRGFGKFSNGKSWDIQSFKTQLSVWKFYHILICFIYLNIYLLAPCGWPSLVASALARSGTVAATRLPLRCQPPKKQDTLAKAWLVT